MAAQQDGTFTAFVNIGFVSTNVSQDSAVMVYENIGLEPPSQVTIVRPPHGWGLIPTGSQSVTILSQAASATGTAYENTT